MADEAIKKAGERLKAVKSKVGHSEEETFWSKMVVRVEE